MASLKTIDKQTLKLVDYLIQKHQETGTNLDLVTDYAFGVKFYPHNKYIITHMRGKEVEGGKEKHAPHLLIINLGTAFDLDFNYFYDESIPIQSAFLTEKRNGYSPNTSFLDEVFAEIDKRFEKFIAENRLLHTPEEQKHYKTIEHQLYSLKVELNDMLSGETILNKKSVILEWFDRLLTIGKQQIETSVSKMQLETALAKTGHTESGDQSTRIRQLEQDVQSLTKELADCNKMAFEAQKGQTEALKELLALKTKE